MRDRWHGVRLGAGLAQGSICLLPSTSAAPRHAPAPSSGVANSRDARLQAGRPSAGGSAGPDFVSKRNLERAKADSLAMAVCALIIGFCLYHQTVPAHSSYLKYWSTLLPTLLLMPWSRIHPASYMRWRGLLVTLLRLALIISPLAHRSLFAIAGRLGQLALGPLGHLTFLCGLLFISQGTRLAILGLGLPLCAPVHIAVQAAMTAVAWRDNAGMCQAVVSSGASLAAGSGGLHPLVEGGPHVPAAAAAAGMLEGWHSLASMLSLWLPPFTFVPRQLSPLQQCHCLLSFAQLSLGFLLPVAVHLLLESRLHCMHHRQRLASSQGSPARQPLQPAAPACATPAVYRRMWEVVESMLPAIRAWVVLLVLATAWEGASAAV